MHPTGTSEDFEGTAGHMDRAAFADHLRLLPRCQHDDGYRPDWGHRLSPSLSRDEQLWRLSGGKRISELLQCEALVELGSSMEQRRLHTG